MTRYKYSRKQIDKALSKWYLDGDNGLTFFEIKGMIMETVPDKPFKWSEIPRPYINRKVEPVKLKPIQPLFFDIKDFYVRNEEGQGLADKINELVKAVNELRRAK